MINLTKVQRLDMVQKGLSPLNEEHVKKYLENDGKIRASNQEVQERLRTLIGADVFGKKNLGSAHETESQYNKAINGGEYIETPQTSILSEQSVRARMNSELSDYVKPSSTSLSSSRLLSLKENRDHESVLDTLEDETMVTKKEAAKIKKIGYEDSIKYLNSFILNLKNPSFANRVNLYNALIVVIKNDKKLFNNKTKLKYYRAGCKEAEDEMYRKLKG